MKSYLADKAVGGGVGGGASIRALESALPFAVLSLREKEHGSSLVVIDSLLWHESLARRQQQRRRWSSERQIKAEEKVESAGPRTGFVFLFWHKRGTLISLANRWKTACLGLGRGHTSRY